MKKQKMAWTTLTSLSCSLNVYISENEMTITSVKMDGIRRTFRKSEADESTDM